MNKVRVYWNLHKKCWSVQDCASNLVVLHARELTLHNSKFVVRKGGQRRVRQEGKKNVHAFVVGYMTYELPHPMPTDWKVTYNPYKHDSFMASDEPIHEAKYVQMVTNDEGRPEVYAMV